MRREDLAMSSSYRSPILRRFAFVLTPIALLAACDDPVEPSGRCAQTSEFGNLGCAVVQGIVRDGAGNPLWGVYVYAIADCCDTPVPFTDSAGRYELVLRWYAEGPLADSVDVWLRVSRPGYWRDSVQARLGFAPVGEPEPINVVDIVPSP
jgi:hypothetical protein